MDVEVEITIEAPAGVVWSVATDIEGSPSTISGIEEVEILERPPSGIVGLKWKESRKIGGSKAVETMWITEADEGSYYVAQARSHGAIYRTRIDLSDTADGTILRMAFSAKPVSIVARIFTAVLSPLMKRSIRNAFMKDLQDIKAAAESRHTRRPG